MSTRKLEDLRVLLAEERQAILTTLRDRQIFRPLTEKEQTIQRCINKHVKDRATRLPDAFPQQYAETQNLIPTGSQSLERALVTISALLTAMMQ